MEALVELSDQLGNPGAAKLFLEAKRRKIKVSRAQVEALVKRQGNRQLFNPVQPSRGKSAAESYSARYQADLADMVNSPSKGFRYFIVLVNVFSREVYAEPLRNKEPVTVAAGLQKLIGALPEKPQVLSTDDGTEFSQHVDDFLQSAGIAHKQHVGKNDVNALAVLDRALQNIKARLARLMARTEGEWADLLPKVVTAYNKTYNAAVHEAPEEILENKEVLFMLAQDNARKLQHNQALTERRVEKLKDAGGFRRPVGTRKFKRGFRATYGEVEEPTAIKGSRVETSDGPIDIKLVQIVEKDSSKATARFAAGDERQEGKRGILEDLMTELRGFLEQRDGRASMTAAAAHLKATFPDYNPLLRAARVETLADAVRLFPQILELTDGGLYVNAV